MSQFNYFFLQNYVVSLWRVCYQRGLAHLVSERMTSYLGEGPGSQPQWTLYRWKKSHTINKKNI